MSVEQETRTRQVTEQHTVAVTCDLCKQRFEGANVFVSSVEWPQEPDREYMENNYAETCIIKREGFQGYYHDEGFITKTAFHLCPECFTGKLMPWLESQGATPTVEECK